MIRKKVGKVATLGLKGCVRVQGGEEAAKADVGVEVVRVRKHRHQQARHTLRHLGDDLEFVLDLVL